MNELKPGNPDLWKAVLDSRGGSKCLDAVEPLADLVPTGENLGHQLQLHGDKAVSGLSRRHRD